jgi:hypothetical protein
MFGINEISNFSTIFFTFTYMSFWIEMTKRNVVFARFFADSNNNLMLKDARARTAKN